MRAESTTISANSSTTSLPPFPPDYRASGVLLHVTSLPSPYGIGDVGPAALAWVDRLHEAGQTWWQALPLGPTGYGNSPYQSLSSFAGNVLLISPDLLIEDGLLRRRWTVRATRSRQRPWSYDAVIPFKHRLLQTSWTNFRAVGSLPDLRPAYEQFCDAQAATGSTTIHCSEPLKAKHRALLSRLAAGSWCGAIVLPWCRPAATSAGQIDQIRFAQFLLVPSGGTPQGARPV